MVIAKNTLFWIFIPVVTVLFFAVVFGLGVQKAVAASSDYYLKLDNIKGESTDDKHKDQIEITSWSWGISNPSSIGSSGGGAGKTVPKDLVITKNVDAATTKLMQACASGEHLKKGELTVSTGKRADYLKYTFGDVVCTSWQPSGANNGAPMEQVSLNYQKITIEYKPLRLTDILRAAWDFARNATF